MGRAQMMKLAILPMKPGSCTCHEVEGGGCGRSTRTTPCTMASTPSSNENTLASPLQCAAQARPAGGARPSHIPVCAGLRRVCDRPRRVCDRLRRACGRLRRRLGAPAPACAAAFCTPAPSETTFGTKPSFLGTKPRRGPKHNLRGQPFGHPQHGRGGSRLKKASGNVFLEA